MRGDLQNEVYADQNTMLTELASTDTLRPRLESKRHDVKMILYIERHTSQRRVLR